MEQPNGVTKQSIFAIVDIFIQGLKNTSHAVLPLTLLASPLIYLYFLYGVVTIQLFPHDQVQTEPAWVRSGFALFLVFGLMYLSYVFLRYIRDVSLGQSERSLLRYFIPQRNILGVSRIALLGMTVGIYFAIVALIGLLFFILPGALILLFGLTWFSLVFVTYLAEPENGVKQAIIQNWRFMKGNVWRTILLGFMLFLTQSFVQIAVVVGILAFFGLSYFVVDPSTSISQAVIPTLAGAGLLWGVLIFGLGTTLFVLFRYYTELKAQQQLSPIPVRNRHTN